MNKINLVIFILFSLTTQSAVAQVNFTSSNLPIVIINTDGVEIPDEPKIDAAMGIIDNGPGQRNYVTDPPNDYNGFIGIETRGSSSQMFPKKSYALETRDANNDDLDVSLLGLPEEEDWILYGPYSDKSLIRNVLTYKLATEMGWYASRTRYCEVVLNGDYRGLYVLMEKIKRDDNRVDIAKLNPDEISGDDLTGGYIIKIDKLAGNEVGGWYSPYPPPGSPNFHVFYQFHYPKPSEIPPEQAAYLEDFITDFENLMASDNFSDPESGYPALINMDSFVDYCIISELSKNVDAYRLSTFMYKDKDSNDPRLVMGPVWDYNIAYGNANYYNAWAMIGFQMDQIVPAYPVDQYFVPFWRLRMWEDPNFVAAVIDRWQALRQDILHADSLQTFVDATATLLDEAQERNFQRWPILGEWVWPNAFVGETYQEEVDQLNLWVNVRLQWLDQFLPFELAIEENPALVPEQRLSPAYPNPFQHQTRFSLQLEQPENVKIGLYDMAGRRVKQIFAGRISAADTNRFDIVAEELPSGVYTLSVRGESFRESRRIVLMR